MTNEKNCGRGEVEDAGHDKAEESAGMEDARRYVTLRDGSARNENGKHHITTTDTRTSLQLENARRDNSGHMTTDTLFTAAYVNRLLTQVNQRLYLLSLLQSSGLQRSSLHLLFNALVTNNLTYALPEYAGKLNAYNEKNMINAISRKAMRRGLTLTAFDIDAVIDKSNRKLFRQATQPGHCLHHLLPPKTSVYSSYQLRKRQHLYLPSTVQYSQFKKSYINRCLFKYV